jgi:hypothetical protein
LARVAQFLSGIGRRGKRSLKERKKGKRIEEEAKYDCYNVIVRLVIIDIVTS